MKKESKKIKAVKKNEYGKQLKISGISLFFLGITMFFFVPFAGMTGNVISSNISEEGSFGLYLIGLALMILGAVLAEYGQRPQEKRPDPIYAQTLAKQLQLKYTDFVRSLQDAGYRAEWGAEQIAIINPVTNQTVAKFSIPKNGILPRQIAEDTRKKVLENLVGKIETAKMLKR